MCTATMRPTNKEIFVTNTIYYDSNRCYWEGESAMLSSDIIIRHKMCFEDKYINFIVFIAQTMCLFLGLAIYS